MNENHFLLNVCAHSQIIWLSVTMQKARDVHTAPSHIKYNYVGNGEGQIQLGWRKAWDFFVCFLFLFFFFKVIRLMKGFMIGVIENVRVRWAGHVEQCSVPAGIYAPIHGCLGKTLWSRELASQRPYAHVEAPLASCKGKEWTGATGLPQIIAGLKARSIRSLISTNTSQGQGYHTTTAPLQSSSVCEG